MEQMEQTGNRAKPKWGPKMLALPNDRWRRFVEVWLEMGTAGGGYTGAARAAGFKGADTSLKVTAYRLAHDFRIQEAIQEEARKRLNSLVPGALEAMGDILGEKKHKDRALIAKTVLDRTGLHEVAETKHTIEFIGNDPAMLERARQLALRLNMPVEKLLGSSLARGLPAPTPELVAVEAEYEEVEAEPEEEPDCAELETAGASDETERSDVQEEEGELE